MEGRSCFLTMMRYRFTLKGALPDAEIEIDDFVKALK